MVCRLRMKVLMLTFEMRIQTFIISYKLFLPRLCFSFFFHSFLNCYMSFIDFTHEIALFSPCIFELLWPLDQGLVKAIKPVSIFCNGCKYSILQVYYSRNMIQISTSLDLLSESSILPLNSFYFYLVSACVKKDLQRTFFFFAIASKNFEKCFV